jgi:hypothetical protein
MKVVKMKLNTLARDSRILYCRMKRRRRDFV